MLKIWRKFVQSALSFFILADEFYLVNSAKILCCKKNFKEKLKILPASIAGIKQKAMAIRTIARNAYTACMLTSTPATGSRLAAA